MSEQSDMIDRVERLARELGRVERELEDAQNCILEGLTASKTDFDPEIVSRIKNVLDYYRCSSDDYCLFVSDDKADGLRLSDLRKLYDAVK